MKYLSLIILSVLCSASTLAQETPNYVQDQLIIKFQSTELSHLEDCVKNQRFDIAVLDSLNAVHNVSRIKLTGNRKTKDSYILFFSEDQDVMYLVELYEGTGLFDYVEPNFIGSGGGSNIVPNDAYFFRQYGLLNDGSFSLSPAIDDADIDMELAWEIEQGSSTITIASLDSGVKLDHPEFSGRIWQNSLETINLSDDDGNGYADDVEGWDFANDDNDPTDDQGHGTNVTGIIGANGNNGIGYAGVDWNAQLMALKILDAGGSGLYSWWSEAIYYAVDNGADVLNMSVGGSSFSSSMEDAVNYAYANGVIVVACMMNEDNAVTYYPAGYANTIAVGATNPNDERATPFFWSASSGSCFGAHIDVIAPGNYVYGLSYTSDTGYGSYWGGTSQAAPLVAGLSALLLAQDPSRTPDEVRTIIQTTAEDQVGDPLEDSPGFDQYYGHGRINAYEALLQSIVGIEDDGINGPAVTIFPNPASNTLYVKSDVPFSDVLIINALGEVMFQELELNSQKSMLDISELPTGIYFLKLLDQNGGLLNSERLVKG